ncbi:transposase [Mangrovivirga sp. M17]|uniref:Transposase n=1 Tax=Mangrovivirga halotolerans TaxID=2993936 RepID=A0ABT3RNE7_9BACT|nr:transposase [Mangrovivirga halotolerans]MCX2742675.1 transposase [Mangrovivirga halotolerans]
MSEKYKFSDPKGIYFVTCTVVHWIDLFTQKHFRYIVIDSLKHCQENKGLIIYSWCIMPSHIHLIGSTEGIELSAILRDFKKYVSKKIIKELDIINESRKEWLLRAFKNAGSRLKRIKNYKVWQDGNHPVLLETNKFINQKLAYIHNNPVEAEIVDEPEEYLYSSARDYCGNKKGLLKVTIIE